MPLKDRMPPYSAEAERAVLGSLLIDSSLSEDISLEPTDLTLVTSKKKTGQ